MAGRSPQTEEERLAQALGWALAQVNRRERTVAELRAHLDRKGVGEATAEAAVAELVEQGLVDDARFAEMYVADKRGLERWGVERIRRGLRERGVERELAERALGEPVTSPPAGAAGGVAGDTWGMWGTAHAGDGEPETELDRALELLRRRFPDPPRDRRDRDRALGVLLRKGYESELAVDALAAYARGD